eukprot:CAMPEP_0171125212 /NCGR_PEP_ID=MMETSP0766_2-20121228/110789_1 /TAXON_ID=439317 /ORGANISM="Gambierdiscus australes, Strain CAWD 149" /LENGTH=94 /DNA_ID=CAMNT_0011588185 /DNA_START=343 /DNA_END=624 /DNA_ORIENTATION=+
MPLEVELHNAWQDQLLTFALPAQTAQHLQAFWQAAEGCELRVLTAEASYCASSGCRTMLRTSLSSTSNASMALSKGKVLSNCSSGLSRSATLVP